MKIVAACWVWCFSLMWLAGQGENDLFTNTYTVPPTFLQGHSEQGWQPRDPFAEFQADAPRKTAKQILQDGGISFGEGASAIYNASTSQLIVRNTKSQIELVEVYIESIRTGVAKQIYLSFREIIIEEADVNQVQDLGFDWLLVSPENSDEPVNGRRRSLDSYQSFLQELSRPPAVPIETVPVSRRVAGVFTDPQFQVMIRALKQELTSEVTSLPSLMVRSGQPGMVEVGEQRYGAIANLGADEFTIDLAVFLPEHGKALFQPGDDLSTPYMVTIWDGQTVALSVSVEGEGTRTVFLRAQIMDPAGMPINSATELIEGKKINTETTTPIETPKSIDPIIKAAQETWMASLPQGASYLVKKGDTLYSIATDKNASVAELKELNRLDSDYVEEGQVILVPGGANGVPGLESVLASTIIPSVAFEDTPFVDALGFLHRVLLTDTGSGLFPTPASKIIFKGTENFAATPVTLRLSNVPAKEALRYLTSLAQCRYEVEGTRIMILPLE